MNTPGRTRGRLAGGMLLVFAVAWLLYAPTLKFDFVWDDFGSIVHNQALTDWSAAFRSFRERPALPGSQYDPSQLETLNYRPLRTIAHTAIAHAAGLDPVWYHAVNVTGHALAAALLFGVLWYLIGSWGGALAGALFFAVQPVSTEPVCWCKSLEDMMAAILVIGAWWCFEVGRNGPDGGRGTRRWSYPACLLLYLLALTAKLSVVFLPLFLALQWLIENRRAWLAAFRRDRLTVAVIGGLGGLTAAGLAVQHAVLGHTAQGGFITGNGWTTWLSMPRILVRYLFIEFVPTGMLADYEAYPRASSLTDWTAWLYAAVLLLILIGGSRLLGRNGLWRGWLWFWCALLPFFNLVPMVQLGADRFLYLATIGMAWLVAELCGRFMKTSWQRLAVAVLLSVFAFCAWQRSAVWKNEETLWTATVRQTPTAFRPRENLIKAQLARRELVDALDNAEYLARRSPKPAHQILYGYALCLTGDYQHGLGILSFHRADSVLNIVGVDAIRNGQLKRAEQCFQAAIKINPNDPRYRHNLMLVRRQMMALPSSAR